MTSEVVGTVVLLLTALATANINEQCKVHEETVKCQCIGKEEFNSPWEDNYINVTSLQLTSCASATLLSSLSMENIQEIKVRNIKNRLNFEPAIKFSSVKVLELANVGRVPNMAHFTFVNVDSIVTLNITNTLIEYFEERFTEIEVKNFVLTNVTIERMKGINLSKKGATLHVINSSLRNIENSLSLANFTQVKIINSIIELRQPGNLYIGGDVVLIENNVFSNASMNVIASNNITVNGICANGKSALRLSSPKINSSNNRLPTEIVYSGNATGFPTLDNKNAVCVAGNCKCPKSNGKRRAPDSLVSMFVSQLFLLTLLSIIL